MKIALTFLYTFLTSLILSIVKNGNYSLVFSDALFYIFVVLGLGIQITFFLIDEKEKKKVTPSFILFAMLTSISGELLLAVFMAEKTISWLFFYLGTLTVAALSPSIALLLMKSLPETVNESINNFIKNRFSTIQKEEKND